MVMVVEEERAAGGEEREREIDRVRERKRERGNVLEGTVSVTPSNGPSKHPLCR